MHSEEFNDSYVTLNIILVMKLKRMRHKGHAAHTGEKRSVYIYIYMGLWWGNQQKRDV